MISLYQGVSVNKTTQICFFIYQQHAQYTFLLSVSNKTMQYTSSLTRPPNALHRSTMQHFILTLLNYRPIVPQLLTLHSKRVLNPVLLKTTNYQCKMAVRWQNGYPGVLLPGISGTITITSYTTGCLKLASSLQPITTVVRHWVGFHKMISYWEIYY